MKRNCVALVAIGEIDLQNLGARVDPFGNMLRMYQLYNYFF